MLISVRCKCGRRLKVADTKIGQTGTCPACHATLRLLAPGYSADHPLEFDHLLTITAGPQRVGEVILLAGPGPIEIGKLAGKHLLLDGKSVSRAHCRLIRDAGQWRIEDQRSTNGIVVNGRRVRAHDLANGDAVRIGEYELGFAAASAANRAAENHVAATDAPVAALPKSPAAASSTEPQPALLDAEALDDDSLYRLSDGAAVEAPPSEPGVIQPIEPETGGLLCPSCGKSLPPKAKICVTCGIDLKTGRAILTSHGGDMDAVYMNAEGVIRWVSWFIWVGIYPVASEGFGLRKPYFTRAVTVLTVLISLWFLAYEYSDSPRMASMKNYMLWVGNAEPKPAEVIYYYAFTNYGDSAAFEAKLDEMESGLADRKVELEKKREEARTSGKPFGEASRRELNEIAQQQKNLIVAAHKALPREQQYQGRYAPSQLITHALLHGGIMHLVGNMLFLMVIGSRINALVGNLFMIVLYPVLAVTAGIIFMASQQAASPHPCLGASGAIMGLCGMYLVLMPIHRIHMAAWWRMGLRMGFRLALKIWAMRGFWVVLFYIAFDVAAVLLGSQGGVAHWAHLGGFLAGMALGLLLLFARLVNCRGGDLVSGLLGKRAWGLVGKPDLTRKAPLEYGW